MSRSQIQFKKRGLGLECNDAISAHYVSGPGASCSPHHRMTLDSIHKALGCDEMNNLRRSARGFRTGTWTFLESIDGRLYTCTVRQHCDSQGLTAHLSYGTRSGIVTIPRLAPSPFDSPSRSAWMRSTSRVPGHYDMSPYHVKEVRARHGAHLCHAPTWTQGQGLVLQSSGKMKVTSARFRTSPL